MSQLETYERPTILSLEGREILESIGPALAGPSGGGPSDLGDALDPYGGGGYGGRATGRKGPR